MQQKWLRLIRHGLVPYRSQVMYSLLGLVIAIGIFFRFVGLDTKVVWGDETLTAIRTSGYKVSQVVDAISGAGLLTPSDIQNYQRLNPEKDLEDMLGDFKSNSRPPLYYVLGYEWKKKVQPLELVPRALAAWIGVLAIPCMYWLSWELFESSFTSAFATALFAISPVHILYAQEGREYSLLTLTILISSAILLKTIKSRENTLPKWFAYSVSVALGLYTQWLFVLPLGSHVAYTLFMSRLRKIKLLLSYGASLLLGLILFLPWLIYMKFDFISVAEDGSWARQSISHTELIQSWLLNMGRVFFDLNQSFSSWLLPAYLLIVIVAIYSFYYCYRKAPRESGWFLIFLAGVTAFALLIPDVIGGERRSLAIRYVLPCCLGLQLAVSFTLANNLRNGSSQMVRRIALGITVLLWSCGVMFGAVSLNAEYWWNKYAAYGYLGISEVINQSQNPLLLTNNRGIFGLALRLNSNVKVYWLGGDRLSQQYFGLEEPLTQFSDIYLYPGLGFKDIKEAIAQPSVIPPSESLELEQVGEWKHEVQPGFQTNSSLWKLVPAAEQ